MMLLAQVADVTDKVIDAAKSTDYSLVGVLVVSLAVIGYVTHKGLKTMASWVASEIIIPARDKGFRHLEKVEASMDGLTQAVRVIPERLDRIEVKVDTLGERVDRVDEHLIRQDAKSDAFHLRVN